MPGSVVWHGAAEIKAALAERVHQMDERAQRFVAQGALAIQREAQQNANTGAHKQGQPRSGGPGPNVVTGLLRRAITTNPPVRLGSTGWYAECGVSTAARYGQYLETGTRHMSAYPFFVPALRQVQNAILPALFRTTMKG